MRRRRVAVDLSDGDCGREDRAVLELVRAKARGEGVGAQDDREHLLLDGEQAGDVAYDSFLSIFTASLNADSISDKALVKILPIKEK